MQYKHFTSTVLGFATAGFLTVGISFVIASTGAIYVAELGSGGGVTLIDLPYQVSDAVFLESLHGAAFAEPMSAAAGFQLVIGMLLIVAGFCLHALWLIRFGHMKANRKKEPQRAAWISEMKEWMEQELDRRFSN